MRGYIFFLKITFGANNSTFLKSRLHTSIHEINKNLTVSLRFLYFCYQKGTKV